MSAAAGGGRGRGGGRPGEGSRSPGMGRVRKMEYLLFSLEKEGNSDPRSTVKGPRDPDVGRPSGQGANEARVGSWEWAPGGGMRSQGVPGVAGPRGDGSRLMHRTPARGHGRTCGRRGW